MGQAPFSHLLVCFLLSVLQAAYEAANRLGVSPDQRPSLYTNWGVLLTTMSRPKEAEAILQRGLNLLGLSARETVRWGMRAGAGMWSRRSNEGFHGPLWRQNHTLCAPIVVVKHIYARGSVLMPSNSSTFFVVAYPTLFSS